MKILHMLYAGGTGGIEKLCKDIGLNSTLDENIFWFVHEGGNICEEMKREKLKIIETDYENKKVISLYKHMKEVVRSQSVDIILVHHPAPLVWLSLLFYMRSKQRARVIVYAHNSYKEITKRSKFKTVIYDRLLLKSDGIIAISQYVKSTFSHVVNLPAEKISVVYNGVDTANYQTIREGIHQGSVKILYVGRLIPEKGVDKLLDAVSKMECKDYVSVTIVGDGKDRKRLENIVIENNLEQQVNFEGIQRNVPLYMENADVFVHPAVWEEGFGITIVEAMSAGLVCVAFSKGALPEIIDDGINGFIVEECSEDALAYKLQAVCKEIMENNMLEIRSNAVKRAEDFTVKILLDKLHAVYCACNMHGD